jgi:hypothetical protein
MMIGLTLALAVAAAPAVQLPADGTYAYTGARAGQPFGHTRVTVSHDATTVTIVEDGNGAINGTTGTAQATLVLAAADLSPTSYISKLAQGSDVTQSNVAFSGNTATLTGAGDPQTFTLADGTTHFALADGALLDGFVALPAQLAAWNGSPATLLIPIYEQAIPLALSATAPARPAGVPAGDKSITASVPVEVTEWYDPATMIPDEIDVPMLSLTITRQR